MIKKIIRKLKESGLKDVCIIGDVMLDEYVFGAVTRISPEAPVPIMREERREWSLGGAANVALNCKYIGCNVNLIGLVGDGDISGDRVISMLKSSGLSTQGILKSKFRSTTNKKRLIAKNHQLMRVDLEDDFMLCEQERFEMVTLIHSIIRPNSIVVISDYAKGAIDEGVMQEIIIAAKANNCMILVDPKGPDFGKYKGATYMKPNYKEFQELVDYFKLPQDAPIIENSRKICEFLDLEGIIVTRGEKGITFVSHDEDAFIPSIKREVFDLTGAGDTVIAFLAYGLLNSLSMNDALKIANKAASVAISHLKTYAVGLDELTDESRGNADKYYQSWDELKPKLDDLKHKRKRIIFTNGCFDILHSGHIHMLKEAKKHGDIMVVGLNSDESIKRLKGDNRPLKPLDERVNVMSALEVVDFVVSFQEDTPLELIKALHPDVLIKGVDYRPEQVVGYKEIKAYGGEVVIIGWKNKHSTTSLIEKRSSL